MRIVISGTPGSGKSTVAKIVAAKLKYKYYSMGELQRRYAKNRRVSISQLMRMAEHYPQMDREIDAMQRELAAQEDNFVIDSRLGAYFVPQAELKIFLNAKPEVRAERIWKAARDEEQAPDQATALSAMQERDASDERRYAQLYGISYQDPTLYDRSIDTSTAFPEEIAAEIISLLGNKGEDKRKTRRRTRS